MASGGAIVFLLDDFWRMLNNRAGRGEVPGYVG
jgi:hypothetical protein